MKLFSQREGFSVRDSIQIERVDAILRNRLWNLISKFYWKRISARLYGGCIINLGDDEFFDGLWDKVFKMPVRGRSERWIELESILERYFLNCEWYTVYDFLEHIANEYWDQTNEYKLHFMNACNTTLEEESSGYRFSDSKIVRKISEQDSTTIEKAISETEKLHTVNTHLKTAFRMATDRKHPDQRNSIKESISAVEALCKIIAGRDKVTLNAALEEIEASKAIELHPALKKAFSNLYGYTNDAEGIRHALLEESKLEFEDAMFMLSSCSAFVSYLIAKCSKAGIKLQ